MAYATEKKKLGKIPVTIVEVDLDKCTRTYGTAPCTASGSAGSECYNTRKTCQDISNFSKKVSNGLDFTAANEDRVNIGSVTFATSFSVVMRIKTAGVSTLQRLSGYGNSNFINIKSVTAGAVQFYPPGGGVGFDTGANTLSANTDHHIIITCTNNSQEIFIDNVSVGTGTLAYSSSTDSVGIGNNHSTDAGVGYDGDMYEWILYSKILSSGERATLYSGGEVTDSRQIYHKFDTGEGLTATDTEGANHGTIEGATWLNVTDNFLTHTFKSADNNNPEIEGIPCINKVSSAPTKIILGKGLGYRAKVTLNFTDFTHHDRGLDPYVSTRSYDPETQGTYFGKLKARNPYYQGRTIRIKNGYDDGSYDATNFITRQYIIESMSGPDEKGQFQIVAKDPLKLADNDRSQCPAGSTGSLSTAYTAGGTSLVLNTGDGAGYSASGEVRIGDNILSYTGVSTDTLTGVTGGQWGTTDANADSGDKVQQCKSWSSVNVVDIIKELLEDFAGVDTAFINATDWADERDRFLSTTTLTAIISEPTGVKELIEELTEQFLIDVWWADDEQLIKLQSIIPKQINTTEDEYTDENHILNKGIRVTENVKDRITQVWFYYDIKDNAESLDAENMGKIKITISSDSESADLYGDKRIRKIFSRWTDSESLAIQTGGRLLNRDASNRTQIKFNMDIKDSDLKTGNHFYINTKYIPDETGASKKKRMQVMSHDEVKEGMIAYDAVEVNFTGRYFFIAPNTTPNYASATEDEKARYGFISNGSSNFSDGGEPYKII